MAGAVVFGEDSVPHLPRGVRLKFDTPRDQWVLLAPERMFVLDEIAHEIIKCCDGEANVAAIVDDLSGRFEAPRDAVAKDVIALLQDFADKGVMDA
ncbi:MAG: pyrroloquinoline quinone biosynthesis peptide chaperone PqqD [Rhodospirillales bacterium]|nr:pyrroloquinoline quinone biosynthesis peptide chaperone PqqD [Rhodospirillales bacterium]